MKKYNQDIEEYIKTTNCYKAIKIIKPSIIENEEEKLDYSLLNNILLSKHTYKQNMIDILLCLRNNCAHTTLLNRFRTEKRYRINALLIASFSLTPKNADSVLKLFDSIKILSFFTDVSALKKPLRTLKFKIYVSMGIKKGKTVYNKILARMGCGDYKKWNIDLFETKYFL